MKIIKNSLSSELSQLCFEKINELKSEFVWSSSTIRWSENIKVGITGSCLSTPVDEKLQDQILQEISEYLPDTSKEILTMFYIWQPNSGMSRHLDSSYKFAATIYLNNYWNIEWGGNFLYYKKPNIDWNTPEEDYMYDYENWSIIVPEHKTMILNTDKLLHMVTPISPFCPELRYTIQVFGS